MKNQCKICNSSNLIFLLKTKKANRKLEFVQCKNCGFVFNDPPPDQKWLDWFYSANNISAKEFESHQNQISKDDFSLWQRRFKGILKYKKSGQFLDIGCGKGILLFLAQKAGFKVYGTEYSLGEIRYCKKFFHLKNIYQGDISQIKKEKFDVITLFHVLEHIPDFRKYLQTIKQLLKKDGILVIEVPNKDWIKKKSYLEKLMPHQIHHNHFSAENLKFLLEKEDFEILSFKFDNPFHVGYFNKWTIFSVINKIFFQFKYYNFSPVIKIYAKLK